MGGLLGRADEHLEYPKGKAEKDIEIGKVGEKGLYGCIIPEPQLEDVHTALRTTKGFFLLFTRPLSTEPAPGPRDSPSHLTIQRLGGLYKLLYKDEWNRFILYKWVKKENGYTSDSQFHC